MSGYRSKASRCIAELLNFKRLFIRAHSVNIGTTLTLNLASELSHYCDSVCIFISKELEHILTTTLHNIQLCESQSVCPKIITDIFTGIDVRKQCRCAIFLQWKDRFVNYEREQTFSRTIVITIGKVNNVSTLLKNRMYKRVVIRNINGNRYLIKFSDKICFIVVEQGIIRDMDIPHDIVRAYSILRSYFIEFGALRVKDAVNALSKELMVDKAKAREVLQNLAKLHLINIRSGYIEVSMKSISLYEDQGRDVPYKM